MPFWRLFYHMVWATKGREPLIQPRFEANLYRVIAAEATGLGTVVQAVGGIEDHLAAGDRVVSLYRADQREQLPFRESRVRSRLCLRLAS